MKNNIIAIVQARMGASRLPNKMMLHLHGYPLIEWIRQRVSKSKLIQKLVFALPDKRVDDILDFFLKANSAYTFRGSEKNVLERFYQAATLFEATHVVRVCADNPLIYHEELDRLIDFYLRNPCDYAYNHIPRNNQYPDGLGAEIVSYQTLKMIYENAKLDSQKEHIFNFIRDNEKDFEIKTFDPMEEELKRPDIKLDVDTFEDYEKMIRMNLYIDITPLEIIKLYR